MGIKINVVDNGTTTTTNTTPDNFNQVVTVTNTTQKVVVGNPLTSVVIEALRGQPGLQNVFVQATAPVGPEENTVWIDIS